uniref:Uncharacterized protein n=1 Tax=Arundo donax TaxID=35708 RepID=A0A0A9ASR3_ARUDO
MFYLIGIQQPNWKHFLIKNIKLLAMSSLFKVGLNVSM